jgi:hypothetical protein
VKYWPKLSTAHETPKTVFQSKSLATDFVPVAVDVELLVEVAVALDDGAIVVVAPSAKVYAVQHAARTRKRVRKGIARGLFRNGPDHSGTGQTFSD